MSSLVVEQIQAIGHEEGEEHDAGADEREDQEVDGSDGVLEPRLGLELERRDPERNPTDRVPRIPKEEDRKSARSKEHEEPGCGDVHVRHVDQSLGLAAVAAAAAAAARPRLRAHHIPSPTSNSRSGERRNLKDVEETIAVHDRLVHHRKGPCALPWPSPLVELVARTRVEEVCLMGAGWRLVVPQDADPVVRDFADRKVVARDVRLHIRERRVPVDGVRHRTLGGVARTHVVVGYCGAGCERLQLCAARV